MEQVNWKKIKDYENYEVSDMGQVRNATTRKILKPWLARGYKMVEIRRKDHRERFLIHRLVASAFIQNNTNLPYINHKDEDKTNNCVMNLEWCTPRYNSNYGTRNKKISESRKLYFQNKKAAMK